MSLIKLSIITLFIGIFFFGYHLLKPHKPINIGLCGNFSTEGSSITTDGRNGAQIAINEINTAGGVMGRQLALITKDIENTPDRSKKSTKELINLGVDVIIGPFISHIAPSVIEEAARSNTLVISPTVSSSRLTQIDDNFIMINSTAFNDGKKIGEAVLKNKHGRVSLVASEYNLQYTNSFIGGTLSALQSSTTTSINSDTYNEETINNYIKKQIAQKPDAIVVSSLGKDAAYIIQQLAKNGVFPKAYTCKWAKSTGFLSYGGKHVEGSIIIGRHTDQPKSKKENQFIKEYQKLHHNKPSFAAYYAYEAIYIFAEAFQHNGGDRNYIHLNKSIQSIRNFEGINDSFSFDSYGSAQRTHTLFTIINSNYVIIP